MDRLVTTISSRLANANRNFSSSSLEPYEDPVSGLERVQTVTNANVRARRQRELDQRPTMSDHSNMSLIRSHSKEDQQTLSDRYESLDYEIVENHLYRQEESHPAHQDELWRQSVHRWLVAFLIGVITALMACFIDVLVYYFSVLKFRLLLTNLFAVCSLDRSSDSYCLWMVQLSWVVFNCMLVSVAASLVVFVAPVAAGSGIPQIKCFLNGIHIPEVVRLKTLVVKVVGVACSVGGGLAVGKEGPMIHSGAIVAAGVSQGRCISIPFDFHMFKYFRNDHEKRDFVSAGAAAGVAAAFGAPIGGVLFSLEEGASFWKQSLTWRIFFSAMISSFTLSFMLSIFYGESGWLSWTGLANFGTFKELSYTIWELPFFLLVGVFGGLSGALFNALNYRLSVFRLHFVTHRWQKLAECLLVAAMSALVSFLTIFAVDDCQPLGVDPDVTELAQLWCRNGEYSAVAHLLLKSPEESVKSLLHSPLNAFRPLTLFVFALTYFLLSTWTYGISVPSGLFIPMLLTGAAWGRLFGLGVQSIFPTITGALLGKYALAGAAAQLGGVVRMTISLTAIIVEATRDITFGLSIMLVLMVAKWVGDYFNEGLYDTHIELAEVPFLGWDPPHTSRNILAGSVMRKDVIAVLPKEKVGRVVDLLKSTRHHGYPVVDKISGNFESFGNGLPQYGHLKGLVLRSQLLTLLRHRAFSYSSSGRDMVLGWSGPLDLASFQETYPRQDQQNADLLNLNVHDRQCWLDLTPYLHPSPHRVPLTTSLPSIFRLFRGLGLRFLLVVDDANRLQGVITRKDVARFRSERIDSVYRVNEVYISETH